MSILEPTYISECSIERSLITKFCKILQERLRGYESYQNSQSYAGLCFEQVGLMEEIMKSQDFPYVEVRSVHGEIRQFGHIPSRYWGIQHTIGMVVLRDRTWYFDVTGTQFDNLIGPQSEIYLSTERPAWHLADVDSMVIRSWHLQQRIIGHIEVTWFTRLVEWFVYDVQGWLSDWIGVRRGTISKKRYRFWLD